MQTIGLKELKEIENGLLVEFAAYCERHGLRYYLYAGTLLGAVRHRGFIPWDDDIDVCMPRPDYERFYALSKEEPVAPHISAVTYRDTPSCLCPFIKLQDMRTEGHEDELRDEFKTSVWIDIFPLDGMLPPGPERDRAVRRLGRLNHLISLCSRPFVPCWNPLRLLKRTYIYLRYSRVDLDRVCAEIEEIATRLPYDGSEEVSQLVFLDILESVSPREAYDHPCRVEFEGRMYPAPADCDANLTRLYGDYMTPPPEEERHPHPFHVWWKDGFGPSEG